MRFADKASCFLGKSYFDPCYPHLIEVGIGCVISDSTILTHDSLGVIADGMVKVGRVVIGNRVSIGYGSIILPGVQIDDDSIVGAGSVVISGSHVPTRSVWAGNPARMVMPMNSYCQRRAISEASAHYHLTREALLDAMRLPPCATMLVRHGRYWRPE